MHVSSRGRLVVDSDDEGRTMIALLPWVLPSVDEGPVALLLGVEGGDNGPALGDHSPMREAKAFMGLCWVVAAMVFIDDLMVVLRVIEFSKG